MEFKDVIRKRYSCRKFSDRPVEQEKLREVLEAGRLAPTAKNFQEQHVYVVQSGEGIAKIDAVTPCRYGAPAVLAVTYDICNTFVYPGGKYDSGAEDAAIAATHMILAAADQGLQSCWVNRFDPEEVASALGLGPNERVLMLMDIGYAAEGGGPGVNHEKRKPLSETMTML